MRRYNNYDYIMDMGIDDFIDFIIYSNKKATDEHVEERAWQAWVTWVPHMGENKITWEEFLATMMQEEIKEDEPRNGVYVDQICI